jgi:hypothetical protein
MPAILGKGSNVHYFRELFAVTITKVTFTASGVDFSIQSWLAVLGEGCRGVLD